MIKSNTSDFTTKKANISISNKCKEYKMSEIINTCGGETCKKNSKEVNRYPTLYEKSHKNYVGKNANCKM